LSFLFPRFYPSRRKYLQILNIFGKNPKLTLEVAI